MTRASSSSGVFLVAALATLGVVLTRRRRMVVRSARDLAAVGTCAVLLATCAVVPSGCTNGAAVSTADLANGCTEVRRNGGSIVVCDPAQLDAILAVDEDLTSAPRTLPVARIAPRTLTPAVPPVGHADHASGARPGLALDHPATPPTEGRPTTGEAR